MSYLLDTDTFSAIARGTHAPLMSRVADISIESLAVSVITVGEIRFGRAAAAVSRQLEKRIDQLLGTVRQLAMAPAAAQPYGELRAYLKRKGTPIGPNDLWIAAHALTEGLILVTNNLREYSRVPGLRIENWLR